MLTQYTPSGRTNPATFVMVIPALVGAVILAGIYTMLSHWIPIIYVDALLSLGAAFVLMVIAAWAVATGKCRNPAVGALFGLLTGIAFILASHYTVYLWDTRSAAAGSQPAFADYLQAKVQTGLTFGRRKSSGASIDGWMIWTIWAIEAVIVFGAAMFGGHKAANEPFCEPCDQWAKIDTYKFDVPGLSPESIKAIGDADSLEPILMPPMAEITPSPTVLQYHVRSCPKCRESSFLDLEVITTKYDNKGQASTETNKVGSRLVLAPVEVEAIGQLMQDVETALSVSASEPGTPEESD